MCYFVIPKTSEWLQPAPKRAEEEEQLIETMITGMKMSMDLMEELQRILAEKAVIERELARLQALQRKA